MMTDVKWNELCKKEVMKYTNLHTDVTDNVSDMTKEDVFVVWSCKTLQNWKSLLSTTRSDGMYYELTYNGDKNEVYFDAYKRWENIKIELQEGE